MPILQKETISESNFIQNVPDDFEFKKRFPNKYIIEPDASSVIRKSEGYIDENKNFVETKVIYEQS